MTTSTRPSAIDFIKLVDELREGRIDYLNTFNIVQYGPIVGLSKHCHNWKKSYTRKIMRNYNTLTGLKAMHMDTLNGYRSLDDQYLLDEGFLSIAHYHTGILKKGESFYLLEKKTTEKTDTDQPDSKQPLRSYWLHDSSAVSLWPQSQSLNIEHHSSIPANTSSEVMNTPVATVDDLSFHNNITQPFQHINVDIMQYIPNEPMQDSGIQSVQLNSAGLAVTYQGCIDELNKLVGKYYRQNVELKSQNLFLRTENAKLKADAELQYAGSNDKKETNAQLRLLESNAEGIRIILASLIDINQLLITNHTRSNDTNNGLTTETVHDHSIDE